MAKNRSELVAEVAKAADTTQVQVNKILDAVFSSFECSLRMGEKVTIPGYFSVETVETAARTGRNPQTGETIKIPAGNRAKLTAGSKLKEAAKSAKRVAKKR